MKSNYPHVAYQLSGTTVRNEPCLGTFMRGRPLLKNYRSVRLYCNIGQTN